MMNVKEIVFNDEGKIVALKGSFQGKKIKARRVVFSKITDKNLYWAEMVIDWKKLGLDYCGG